MAKRPSFFQVLQNNLELPCGVILKNRLAKSPMSDSLGDGEGNPTEIQIQLYEKWAKGEVALSFIGEVQGDPRFPEKPGNLVINETSDFNLFSKLAKRATIDGAHLWPQLGHAGALSHLPVSQPKGPSAISMEGLQSSEMTISEIQALPDMYARTALLAKNNGFGGVHIHAGHGFLLSQFLSPLFNHRNDGYGGSIEARCRIIFEIINKVRFAVGPSFPIGIRINSTDQIEGGLTETESLEAIGLLNNTSIDLIDISGGTYFPGAKSSSESSLDGPYFLDFAKRAKKVTDIPLLVTGGFKKRHQAIEALMSGAADMIGLGRAMIINPDLPKVWFDKAGGDPEFPRFESIIPGGITAWYTMRMTAIAEGREDEFSQDLVSAIHEYETRDSKKCIKWRRKFPGVIHSFDPSAAIGQP